MAGFPVGLGVDASGIIVKLGPTTATSTSKFAVGDLVCGCTRLGSRGYNTAQEFFLMDTHVTIPKPSNISLAQAATVGVGALTACLGLFCGLGITMPSSSEDDKEEGKDKDEEWIIILGGASSVGKFAIQLAVASGFKVAASCSARTADLVRDLDATVFDYKKPLDEQVKDVMAATHGKFARVFDAVASPDGPVLAKALFKELDKDKDKDDKESEGQQKENKKRFFATTNDWDKIGDFDATSEGGAKTYQIALGEVGRPEATQLNDQLASFVPLIVRLLEQDKIAPAAYDVVGAGGFEDAIEAYNYQRKGAGGANKVVVKIQDQ